MKVPNTYVIIFSVLLLCAVATWFIPGGIPQTWQVFSALFEGFSQQAGIIAFVLIIGGAFWIVNSTKAVDAGIVRFIEKARKLERFSLIRKLGIGNIVIVHIMLLFGVVGALLRRAWKKQREKYCQRARKRYTEWVFRSANAVIAALTQDETPKRKETKKDVGKKEAL